MRSVGSALIACVAVAGAMPSVLAASAPPAAPTMPAIDFDALGSVGVAGDFAGLQLWTPASSTANLTNALDPNAATLFARAANGTLARIQSTDTGGVISAICQFSESPYTVFVAGTFDKIGSKSASNIASYDPKAKTWDDVDGGVDGAVNALYCDDTHKQVIAGGAFGRPLNPSGDQTRYLGAVAAWDLASSAWQPVDFGGLQGTVNSIAAGVNASTLRFAGSFRTQFSTAMNGSMSGTNTSASSLTSAFTPLSLGQAEFTGGPPSSDSGFSDPAQILCPQGADGAGNSYLFADGAVGRLTVRTFRGQQVRAIRLGNTFVEGRGTKTFDVVSIPDNTQLELLYLDPTTKQNVTCTTACPLFHDPSVPYQDFLISDAPSNGAVNGSKPLTGIQFTASEYYGAGAGLHQLELLSDGGWAYAYGGLNRGSCSSSLPGVNGTQSSAIATGGWYQSSVQVAGLAGTTEPVLALTDEYSNLAANAGAQVAWNVDIPVDGNYTIYLFVPGCSASGECDLRTDVDVTVMNNATNPGTTTRISQAVQDDTSIVVWDGEVQKAGENFMPSIVLSIPADAPAPSGGGRFTVIADRVNFLLRNSNETFQAAAVGFGVLEYNLFDGAVASLNANGTGALPNTTLTSLSRFGATLLNSGVQANASDSVFAVTSTASLTFVGGNFTSTVLNDTTGFANIVAYTDASNGGAAQRLAGGGLNGVVRALAVLGNSVYVGGDFTSTYDGATSLRHVARYDAQANSWSALGNGASASVTTIVPLGTDSVLLTGDFKAVNGSTTGGIAVWDAQADKWNTEGSFLIGELNVAGLPVDDGSTYVAGAVSLFNDHAAPGSVAMSEGPNNAPQIQPLNFTFAARRSGGSSANARRASGSILDVLGRGTETVRRDPGSSSVGRRWLGSLIARETGDDVAVDVAKRAVTGVLSVPSLQSNGANEVLVSTFWARGTDDLVQVVGGNFSTSDGVTNLGLYDPRANGGEGDLVGLPAFPSIVGSSITVVRALGMLDDVLFAGGDGGLATINLRAQPLLWQTGAAGAAALGTSSGQDLSIDAIAHRPDSNTIIVAGNFDTAGTLPCNGICEWDGQMKRWSSLGSGVEGTITSIDFASRDAMVMLVAGTFSINGGTQTSVASWDFNKQVWTAVGTTGGGAGQIPGPASAISIDESPDAVFVAGRTASGGAPYLVRWDGTSYTALGGSELQSSSGISQLTFMPINRAHPSNSILAENRLLVVSGALVTRSFGNLSSAFFDGASWTPFLIATASNGGPGIVRAIARSTEILRFPDLKHLAVGIVILISIALGLGVVFLLVLIGLVWALAHRRNEPPLQVPMSQSEETLRYEDGYEGAQYAKKSTDDRLATIGAATEKVVGGAGVAGAGAGAAAYGATREYHSRQDSAAVPTTLGHSDETGPSSGTNHSSNHTGNTQYYSGDEGDGRPAPVNIMPGLAEAPYGDSDPDAEGIPAHARYSFEATHESELDVHAGQQIEILDDQDEHWWLARDENGRRGVIPATYVL